MCSDACEPSWGRGWTFSHVPADLAGAQYVYVRVDAVRRPLVRPYDGPFKVKKTDTKTFILDKNGQDWKVSVDRLKVANLPVAEISKEAAGTSSDLPPPISAPPLCTRSGRVSRPVVRLGAE